MDNELQVAGLEECFVCGSFVDAGTGLCARCQQDIRSDDEWAKYDDRLEEAYELLTECE